ncbi:MAG: RNA polymerase sigma-70 factor [Marinilabiliaceae bacterium]|nr:RNA polymerase sigma-70 factor [Marinilabiliaceae bacterium]
MLENAIKSGLLKGDEQTYEYLFRNYYAALCTYAFRYLDRRDLAEEVVSETFLKLWVRRHELRIEGNVKAYLFQAVYKNSLNHLRKQKTETVAVERLQYHQVKEQNFRILEDYSERDSLIFKELEGKIELAVNELPDQARKVFSLKRYDGLKNREVAEQLGISVKTVEMHMTRSLLFLKTELKDYLPAFLIYFILK